MGGNGMLEEEEHEEKVKKKKAEWGKFLTLTYLTWENNDTADKRTDLTTQSQ